LFLNALQANNPLWLRYPAISPDGTQVTFTSGGDIYTVPVSGGEARQITRHPAYDYLPLWSPDGKNIAFASNRFGNFDLYVTPAIGGSATRLTTFSGSETPYAFTPDGKYIVFGAKIQAPAASAVFPSGIMTELYQVPLAGGRPEQILATPAENISFSRDGKKFLFQDRKGPEDRWRKHHRSAVTRNILIHDLEKNQFTELVSDPGENTNPVFSPDNTAVYFLSERSGTYNVHSFPLDNPAKVTQITRFKTNPVRFLSIARNGTLCFGYDGEIYTLSDKGKPQKINIRIPQSEQTNASEDIFNRNISSETVSDDGKQIASLMRGEIFVSSTDYKYTKRITRSAARDNSPSFAPDGRSIAFASEKNGTWNLYIAKISREEENTFFNATLIREDPLFDDDRSERMNPKYSPDGKEIAFIQDRRRLMVYNIENKITRQITDGSGNTATSGAIEYQWSPDGRNFAITYSPNRHDPYSDIGLVSAQGGPVTNLTNSGYTSSNPRWVLDGNAILFLSDRYGMRNHASWGSLDDAMIIFLNQKSYDKFRLSEDDFKILQEEEKKQKDKKTKDEPDKEKKEDPDKEKKNEKITVIELENIEDRILRLTPNSSDMNDAILTKDGDKLYYLAAFEKGYDLWSVNTRTRDTRLEIKDAGKAALLPDKDGKTIFLLGNTARKITLAGNKQETISISARIDLDLAAEREYMFNHVWTQEQKRFYTKDMHGVDWELMKKTYARFLPHINNNFDFAEMLSEMLGELNTSHTGSHYCPPPPKPPPPPPPGPHITRE
jgi:Tol biopolymer transport system component